MAITKNKVVQNFYILPCCLLLLNLVNNVVTYKSGIIEDPYLRTTVVILLVLFGSSVTAFVVAPALVGAVRMMHKSSRRGAGELGGILFFLVLGGIVFWLYFRMTLYGTGSILLPDWRN